jgi:hypothetical protein
MELEQQDAPLDATVLPTPGRGQLMSTITSAAEATRTMDCRCPTCKLLPKIKLLVIIAWLIVPAGGVCGLGLILYLASPLEQLLRLQQPPTPEAQAPPPVANEPPDAPPRIVLQNDVSVHQEKLMIRDISGRYFGSFWRLKPKEGDITSIADWVTSLPTGGILYVDDHVRYSADIKKVGQRHIVLRRREPRWPYRYLVLGDMDQAITILLSQESQERVNKLKQPPDGDQVPF